MAGRVQRLFARYAARHLTLATQGPALFDATGSRIGQIDSIAIANDRLVVAGQCAADQVALELGGQQRLRVPGANGGGNGSRWGQFRLDLPHAAGPALFSYRLAGQTRTIPLPEFPDNRLKLARLALWPQFAMASLRALPAGYRWLRHHDITARARVKKLLGLGAMVAEMQLDPAFLPPDAPALPKPASGITIVLPIYEAFDLLPEVLDRIRRHTDLPWRLIVIEDASPDRRIRPYLRDWAADLANVTLIENPQNLGFIGSVNRGLVLVAGQSDPVVLLNSDAFVPAGWASRLVAPILADPSVASVTPMSNDAELMSVPVICARTDLPPGTGDALDAVARRLGTGTLPAAPTGVGFCMALNPVFLAQVPGLDPAFGRGYGEEVDWCQKVRALHGRHICLPNLFVEHRGGASFGSAAKLALLRQNGALISARYPGYDLEVQRFIAADPLVTARLALGLAWAAAQAADQAIPVYLGHALGGGGEHYIIARIAGDLARVGAAVVLRVGGEERWKVELHSAAGVTSAATSDRALLLRLVRLLPQRDVVYSCGVSDPDPVELPEVLLELGQGQRLEVLVHDYLPISPSYTLLDAAGVYRGLPDPTDRRLRGHDIRRPDGRRFDLAQWQAAWRPLLQAAAEVVVFSNASRDLVRTAYPEIADHLVLRPHTLLTPVPRLTAKRGARPVIGVLGNIGGHKGAGVLVALSRRLARQRVADLVVIGNIDPAYDLPRPARVHGDYQVADLADLVARYGISCWLIPSVWPETFSYTTHEALASGLPVICFDLGAQAEAVRAAVVTGAAGAVLPLADGAADLAAILTTALHLSAR